MKKQTVAKISFLALLSAQILWGINTPVIKLGLETVPLPVFLSVTILGTALLIAPMAARTWKPLRRTDWLLLSIGSLVGITVGNLALLRGLQDVPSVNAPLISLLEPLLLFGLSVKFLREGVNVRTLIGIVVALIGAAAILGRPWDVAGADHAVIIGNLFILLSVLCDVIGTLVCKPVLRRASVYQVTFIHLVIGILPVAVFSITYLNSMSVTSVGRSGFLAMLFNIVLIAAANLFFMYGLKHKKAQNVGVFSYTRPLITLIAAWLILGEMPQTNFYLGAAFIFAGLYLTEFYKPHKRYGLRLRKRLGLRQEPVAVR